MGGLIGRFWGPDSHQEFAGQIFKSGVYSHFLILTHLYVVVKHLPEGRELEFRCLRRRNKSNLEYLACTLRKQQLALKTNS